MTPNDVWHGLLNSALASLAASSLFTIALVFKSIIHFTHGGPRLREEIIKSFLPYAVLAVSRLAAYSLLISTLLAWTGALLHLCVSVALDVAFVPATAFVCACLGIAVLSVLRFGFLLFYLPSSLVVSWQYRYQRLYRLWELLTPRRLNACVALLAIAAISVTAIATGRLFVSGAALPATALLRCAGLPAVLALLGARTPAGPRVPEAAGKGDNQGTARPNVLMIGVDTLRIDRLGVEGYHRDLTPTLDSLASNGLYLRNCYVPIGRTAASLASLLTGTWPHKHGIRDNFVSDDEALLPVAALPRYLSDHGYTSVAIADWAGADLGKLSFGFDATDTPPDQWNLKYYLRQGPMDLRLFLTMFTHNAFGHRFLPELFYLASVPLTRQLGSQTRDTLNALAAKGQPFLLNLFMGTTHVPFGSDHPYYLRFSDRKYRGESKFVMTTLRDPMEIIAKQELPESCFDLPQIINLYDACVRQFDDEVGAILAHLRETGLAANTIVVIYSDHGIDFFENHTWGQGNTVFGSDPGARIPVIIHDPRRPTGREVGEITRSIDILPTLLGLLGIPCPAAVEGCDLSGLLEPETKAPDLPAFQETGIWLTHVPGMHPDHLLYPDVLELLDVPNNRSGTLAIKPQYREITLRARDRMVRRGNWKLVYQPLVGGPSYQLFDLATDPGCTRDMSTEEPQIFARLRTELDRWMRSPVTADSTPSIRGVKA